MPEWGRLLIEADRLITTDDLPLYRYHRGDLPCPIPKDRFAGDTDQHSQARRLMLLTGKLRRIVSHEQRYLVKRGRQVDLRSLMRDSTGNVTLVTDKDAETPGLVIVLERDLREALQRLRESLGEQQTAGSPQPAAPAEGPQSDAETPETPETRREKQARETEEKYKRWHDLAQKIKKEGKKTHPTEIAREIVKREKKGSTERGVNPTNIRRRLDDKYPGWAERRRPQEAGAK